MKVCSFEREGRVSPGVVRDDGVVDVGAVAGPGDPTSLLDWIRAGSDGRDRLAELAAAASAATVLSAHEIHLVNPLPDLPRSVICVAANYRDHVMEAVEAAAARGQVIDPEPYLNAPPSYFTKDPRTVVGPSDEIVLAPEYSTQVDWEVELAVVIGDTAQDVGADEAMAAVFGYAVFNDVSVRDVQRERTQMWKGKNLLGSSPLGPFIVTADEVDPSDLALRCWVSGELMQEGSTSSMIHDVATIISDLSRGFRLDPGDVIATGTTVGTGHSRNPQQFLVAGDVLESEIVGLGRQRNPIA